MKVEAPRTTDEIEERVEDSGDHEGRTSASLSIDSPLSQNHFKLTQIATDLDEICAEMNVGRRRRPRRRRRSVGGEVYSSGDGEIGVRKRATSLEETPGRSKQQTGEVRRGCTSAGGWMDGWMDETADEVCMKRTWMCVCRWMDG